MRTLPRSATVLALLLIHLAGWHTQAAAQYIWVNDKGVKQLSDRPPPPSVPSSHILKMPRQPPAGAGAATSAETGAAPTAPDSPSPTPAPASTADREADFQQSRKAAAAAENKAAGAARDQAQQAANCNAARQNQRALDGGGGIVSYDDNGERSVMNDQQREELAKNTQKVLASCK
jgi:type IV secretory pathway VirB10-like protein